MGFDTAGQNVHTHSHIWHTHTRKRLTLTGRKQKTTYTGSETWNTYIVRSSKHTVHKDVHHTPTHLISSSPPPQPPLTLCLIPSFFPSIYSPLPSHTLKMASEVRGREGSNKTPFPPETVQLRHKTKRWEATTGFQTSMSSILSFSLCLPLHVCKCVWTQSLLQISSRPFMVLSMMWRQGMKMQCVFCSSILSLLSRAAD